MSRHRSNEICPSLLVLVKNIDIKTKFKCIRIIFKRIGKVKVHNN